MGFAEDIMYLRYSREKSDGTKETWEEIADRVVDSVFSVIPTGKQNEIKNFGKIKSEISQAIKDRKFIPGGRFLAQAGRDYHQVNNCLAGETRFVTRDGLRTLEECSGEKVTLLTSGGKWVSGDIRDFGKQRLFKIIISKNKTTKSIYATENHRWMISKAVGKKHRSLNKQEKTTLELYPGEALFQVFGYGISRSRPSLPGIQHGIVFGDGTKIKDDFDFASSLLVLCGKKGDRLIKYFSGFETSGSGENINVKGLPRLYKEHPSLHNDRSYLYGWLAGYFAADGCVSEDGHIILNSSDINNLKFVRDVCYILGIGTNSITKQDRISNLTGRPSTIYKITLMGETLVPDFFLMKEHRDRFENKEYKSRQSWKVESVESTNRYETVYCAVVPETHEFVLEDNILTGNCFTLRATDTREGWGELVDKVTRMLMSGGGVGVDYSALRGKGSPLKRSGGESSGAIPLMKVVNEVGRGVMAGGKRRSAIWAGLSWSHPDIQDFIVAKNWIEEVRKLKEKDFDFPAPLDMTNISVILDKDFFDAYENKDNPQHNLAHDIYWKVIGRMVRTGEPGFSVNYENKNESLRNACTEIVSEDDSDVCCLGSINLSKVETMDEFKTLTELAQLFLIVGVLYSDVPHPKVTEIKLKNMRTGSGLMGFHEWLIRRGYKYEENDELREWLTVWKNESDRAAKYWSRKLGVREPVKKRAIAPNGSISIAGGQTTSGIEPIFSLAYQRRYLTPDGWKKQYVVDFVAEKLHNEGHDLSKVEDAYSLSLNVEKRIKFQRFVQEFVDQSISSTINLPAFGTLGNNDEKKFGHTLMKHLKYLRGITVYPDGARSGQPLVPVDFEYALNRKNVVFEGHEECNDGICGV